MTDEMRLMRETIVSQHSDICQLNRNIDKLNADLRKRDKVSEELKARQSMNGTRTRRHSSTNIRG